MRPRPIRGLIRLPWSDVSGAGRYYFDIEKAQVHEVGEAVFKKQLWQCMMSQALELKG